MAMRAKTINRIVEPKQTREARDVQDRNVIDELLKGIGVLVEHKKLERKPVEGVPDERHEQIEREMRARREVARRQQEEEKQEHKMTPGKAVGQLTKHATRAALGGATMGISLILEQIGIDLAEIPNMVARKALGGAASLISKRTRSTPKGSDPIGAASEEELDQFKQEHDARGPLTSETAKVHDAAIGKALVPRAEEIAPEAKPRIHPKIAAPATPAAIVERGTRAGVTEAAEVIPALLKIEAKNAERHVELIQVLKKGFGIEEFAGLDIKHGAAAAAGKGGDGIGLLDLLLLKLTDLGGKLGPVLGFIGRLAPVLGGIAAWIGVSSAEKKERAGTITHGEARREKAGAVGALAAGGTAALIGAGVGQVLIPIPVVGAAIGAAVGGALFGVAGYKVGEQVGDAISFATGDVDAAGRDIIPEAGKAAEKEKPEAAAKAGTQKPEPIPEKKDTVTPPATAAGALRAETAPESDVVNAARKPLPLGFVPLTQRERDAAEGKAPEGENDIIKAARKPTPGDDAVVKSARTVAPSIPAPGRDTDVVQAARKSLPLGFVPLTQQEHEAAQGKVPEGENDLVKAARKGAPPVPPQTTAPIAVSRDTSRHETGKATTAPAGTPSAADFIAKKEGVRLSAYNDAGQQAIGYGHDITAKEHAQGFIQIGEDRVPVGQKITSDQAHKLLEQDVGQYSDTAKRQIGEEAWGKLNPAQQAALTSYVYNVGHAPKGFAQAVRSGDMTAAAASIEHGIATSRGKYMPVLAARRKEEAQLFASSASAQPTVASVDTPKTVVGAGDRQARATPAAESTAAASAGAVKTAAVETVEGRLVQAKATTAPVQQAEHVAPDLHTRLSQGRMVEPISLGRSVATADAVAPAANYSNEGKQAAAQPKPSSQGSRGAGFGGGISLSDMPLSPLDDQLSLLLSGVLI